LIMSVQFRRLLKSSAHTTACRNYFNFNYPHSHSGVNNAYNNIP
jgi:hypothetical protein